MSAGEGHVFVVHADITTVACDCLAVGHWNWLSDRSRFNAYVTRSAGREHTEGMAPGSVLRVPGLPDNDSQLYLIKPRKGRTVHGDDHQLDAVR